MDEDEFLLVTIGGSGLKGPQGTRARAMLGWRFNFCLAVKMKRIVGESGPDEEVTDPKALLEERSKAKCVSQWYDYQKCVKRIADDETGQKHCTGQYFDYWQCVDKNVAEKLFQMLK
ncbi:hypothetical protein PR202_gb08723 [Eleusine coracana subsp. coracana]|uniref:Complex III subunit VI n=1 Tax=Eleusine coracana subsp. coracana TaxID=191504 RepID=A0AAV5EFL6_ELECO|nr:hypothetical protein PR202_gb08723 [Eleusine coracana subsp. coracana]